MMMLLLLHVADVAVVFEISHLEKRGQILWWLKAQKIEKQVGSRLHEKGSLYLGRYSPTKHSLLGRQRKLRALCTLFMTGTSTAYRCTLSCQFGLLHSCDGCQVLRFSGAYTPASRMLFHLEAISQASSISKMQKSEVSPVGVQHPLDVL